MRLTASEAHDILQQCHIAPETNFFALRSHEVASLLDFADKRGYRKPRNANGSRGRYFYAYLQRALNRGFNHDY